MGQCASKHESKKTPTARAAAAGAAAPSTAAARATTTSTTTTRVSTHSAAATRATTTSAAAARAATHATAAAWATAHTAISLTHTVTAFTFTTRTITTSHTSANFSCVSLSKSSATTCTAAWFVCLLGSWTPATKMVWECTCCYILVVTFRIKATIAYVMLIALPGTAFIIPWAD